MVPPVTKFGCTRFKAATELSRLHRRGVEPMRWSVASKSNEGAWKMRTCCSEVAGEVAVASVAARFNPC